MSGPKSARHWRYLVTLADGTSYTLDFVPDALPATA
jgi:hypothetical protein